MEVVNSIVQGDRIDTIEVSGDTASLLKTMKKEVAEWNKKLG